MVKVFKAPIRLFRFDEKRDKTGMSGLEAVQHLRAMVTESSIEIVENSAYSTRGCFLVWACNAADFSWDRNGEIPDNVVFAGDCDLPTDLTDNFTQLKTLDTHAMRLIKNIARGM